MSEPTREEFIEALRMVEDYVRHRKHCPYGTGMGQPDHCTCGVGDVIEHVDDLLKNTDESVETEN
jgi:hypothetical protein